MFSQPSRLVSENCSPVRCDQTKKKRSGEPQSRLASKRLGQPARTRNPMSGKHLILLNLTKKIRQLLLITKLLTVFQVFEREEAAAASFS